MSIIIDPTEIVKAVLKFDGFSEQNLKDKLFWAFVMWPVMAAYVSFHVIISSPYLIRDMFKKSKGE